MSDPKQIFRTLNTVTGALADTINTVLKAFVEFLEKTEENHLTNKAIKTLKECIKAFDDKAVAPETGKPTSIAAIVEPPEGFSAKLKEDLQNANIPFFCVRNKENKEVVVVPGKKGYAVAQSLLASYEKYTVGHQRKTVEDLAKKDNATNIGSFTFKNNPALLACFAETAKSQGISFVIDRNKAENTTTISFDAKQKAEIFKCFTHADLISMGVMKKIYNTKANNEENIAKGINDSIKNKTGLYIVSAENPNNYLCVTSDQSKIELYVDGKLKGSKALSEDKNVANQEIFNAIQHSSAEKLVTSPKDAVSAPPLFTAKKSIAIDEKNIVNKDNIVSSIREGLTLTNSEKAKFDTEEKARAFIESYIACTAFQTNNQVVDVSITSPRGGTFKDAVLPGYNIDAAKKELEEQIANMSPDEAIKATFNSIAEENLYKIANECDNLTEKEKNLMCEIIDNYNSNKTPIAKYTEIEINEKNEKSITPNIDDKGL